MENQNNTTTAAAPGFTRKTVVRPKTDNPAPEVKAEPTPAIKEEKVTEVMETVENNSGTPMAPEVPTYSAEPVNAGETEPVTDEWESFMGNLRSYDPRGYREKRYTCRLDSDIADALDELDINGSSRPDIVSAVMRGFFQRNRERLLQLRRERRSFFENR